MTSQPPGPLWPGSPTPPPHPGFPAGPGPTAPLPSGGGARGPSGLARGLTRAGVVLVFGGAGVFVWRAVLLAGLPSTPRARGLPANLAKVPAGLSVVYNEPAMRVVDQRLGTTVGSLALALVVGLVVGLGLAALRAVVGPAESGAGPAVGALGWLVGALWTPPVPIAIGTVVLAVTLPKSGTGRTAILVVMLGGVVALLVASAVGTRWRRRAWVPGIAAGVVALGRSLAVLAGALVVGELLTARPGVGALLASALVNQDRYVIADSCTTLLVIALIGQLLAALANVWLAHADRPAPQSQTQGAGRSVVGTALGIVALATLAVPVLVFLGSLLAGNTNRFDLAHVAQGPSSAHPLGTDTAGRDVLARLLVGYQHAFLSAVGAVLLAGIVGVAWGGLAALVARRIPGAGGPLAEVVLAPARLIAVAPLLLAGIMLVAGDRWPATIALAVALVARIAAAIAELDQPTPAPLPNLGQPAPVPLRELGRAAGGLALAAVGVGLAVLVGLGFVGVGAKPPTPALGGVLSDGLQYMYQNDAALLTAVVVLLVTVPWLLAGAALARNPRRAEAVGTLEA
jgi:peptide/nickel transport system permease protein